MYGQFHRWMILYILNNSLNRVIYAKDFNDNGIRSLLMKLIFVLIFVMAVFTHVSVIHAQQVEEERIVYYQMEPYDDSLFIKIQEEVLIDPPDPKAEIIVDLRDPNEQTVSIRGTLYPFLTFTPETRAKIITYPFKLNLLDDVHYGSVFTRVIEKIRFDNLIGKPRLNQILSSTAYVNPYLQIFGGERFGIPIKNDIGISFGLGTPYSFPMETNFAEANFHIIGFYAGYFARVVEIYKPSIFKNPLFATSGYQLGYVIPLGNFLEVSYQNVINDPDTAALNATLDYDGNFPKYISGNYFNWEFRYPLRILGSYRAKVYLAKYQREWHLGLVGRELALAGSVFDLRMDAMFDSDERDEQYAWEILVQRIASSWGFSSLAMGPSVIFSRARTGKFGVSSVFFNLRLKIGTSL